MGMGFDIPWVGVRYTMSRGFDIPCVGNSIFHMDRDQNAIGRRFDIPWVRGSIYNGYGVRNTICRGFDIQWEGCQNTIGSEFDIR
jgi:hypothetical protein